MGANGSGKSTLVRALTGLLPLTAGSLELFGTPIDDFADWRRIGFVPQRVGAASGVPASVWEVVASGRLTRRRLFRPLSRADRPPSTRRSPSSGWPTGLADGVSQLSGGQQQRTLIARALAGEPELFFLDEPTAGVDLPNQLALARRRWAGSRSAAPRSCSSPTSSARWRSLVDRSVVMRDGRIAYDGAPLADHEVHHPDFGESHAHHHHPDPARHDHSPRVASPFERAGRAD